jgi:hypothetical protein
MAEGKLVMLLKFDRKDIVEPTEQICLCSEHYESKKEQFNGYNVVIVNSSMPKFWCEDCMPPVWNY